MSWLHVVVGLVAAQRLCELAWSRRNERRLREAGAVEAGRGHYPLFILLHAGWLATILLAVPPETVPHGALIGLFLALQALRIWIVGSLGRFWTTRILTLPDVPLVRRGPYRWLRHPNYVVVAAEIAVLPLAFGAVGIALIFSAANLILLAVRIHAEEAALASRRSL